ncbi:MAG: PAS domain S-box protein [Armatimonadia bacterium]|nr:PAS domain S-box protein [Armatimonadia bacterium]
MDPDHLQADVDMGLPDERLYRAMFENDGIALFVVRRDGVIAEVNEGLASLLEYSRSELVGLTLADVTHPDDVDRTARTAQGLVRGEIDAASYTKRYLSKHGRAVWAEVDVTAIRDGDGELHSALVIVDDISDRREAEQALLESQRNITHLLNTITDGLIIVDHRGHILGANAAFSDMLGYEGNALRGSNLSDLHPPDRQAEAASLIQDMASGQIESTTVKLVRRDGFELPIETRITYGSWSGESVIFAVCRNVADRMRHEAELRASEEKFSTVFHASPSIMVLSDPLTGELVDVNEAFERATGFPREEVLGHRTRELGLVRDPVIRSHAIDRALTGERVRHLETTFTRRDGEIRTGLFSAELLEIGGERRLLSVTTDITDRKRAEEALRRSEELYRQVVENAGDAIAIIQGGRVTYANPSSEDVFGYRHETLVGMEVDDAIHPDDREYARELLNEWSSGRAREATYEVRIHDAMERVRWIRGTLTTTRWRGAPAILSFSRDVTGLVEAEQAAARAAERLRQIIDLIPVPLSARDADGRFALANRAAAEFYSRTPDEVEGRTVAELHSDEAYVDDVLGSDRAILDGRERLVRPFVKARGMNGQDYVFQTTKIPFALADGRRGVLSCSVDITAMTQAQAELDVAVDELRRSNTDLERFAYVASHDLREPLRTVSYSLHLLRYNYPDVQEGGSGDYLDAAIKGIERMDRLIQDLLTYSRAGRVRAPQPIDPEQVLREAVASLESLTTETEAQITWADLPARIQFDPGQLSIVFQNLLSNAMRFRGDEPARIHVSAERGDGAWLVHVRDEGQGIDPVDQRRIFQMFQRARADRHPTGTGIGLAICARIVESHGGSIQVESEPGEGATFTFSVPDEPPAPADAGHPSPGPT